ncbi:PREDICTED: leucine-rich repeat-containing protein 63-like [Priapulus caudatus]|uniref:Leucine-rich repeat-containing protein 63-like n=1 Tax=Priapulus caudatus TaxID=37621 RepID=A0ABM1F1L3_PRICU|nr:PREDICTED: leucine-rich repeat-containing protein 63-like [Priapulus caudatus]
MQTALTTAVVLSKQNYRKLTEVLAGRMNAKCDRLNSVLLSDDGDIASVKNRVPVYQLLLEVVWVVRNYLGKSQPTHGPAAVMKILPDLAAWSDNMESGVVQRAVQTVWPGQENDDKWLNKQTSSVPLALPADAGITSSELAILHSLAMGGVTLSLKGYFIASLPDMQPLVNSLTYLNLSFNDLQEIPAEVMRCLQLQVLKLRNNPINAIPTELCQLQQLHTLIVSFCLVSTLPQSKHT